MSTIKQEAERCLKCKTPMCKKYCPIGTPIPEVMQLFVEGKVKEAGKIIFDNNPLAIITSQICPHKKNCMGHCVLNKKGTPIEYYRLETYLSELYLADLQDVKIEKNGKRVAIVGGGPSGIAMAIKLLMNGYDVTIFDANNELGGVLRYGIPAFRLPKFDVDELTRIITVLGGKIRYNTKLGTNFELQDLYNDGYKAVFIACGTSRPNKLGILGETLGHVHFAIDYLKSPETFQIGKKVAVIGAGNVAMDAARSAVWYNHSHVSIVNYSNPEDMPADSDEVEFAEIDGVEFIHNAQVIRIMDDKIICVRTHKIESEEGGRPTFEEDYSDTFEIPCDTVILAIGQGPGANLDRKFSVTKTVMGYIEVGEDGQTSTPGVFAAGDIVTGPKTVVDAVAYTNRVYKKLVEYIEGLE